MSSTVERMQDWWVQGFQLNPCYLDDWDEMKSHFTRYGLKFNQHGPIITMSELKFVREAVRLTEMLANNKEYRDMTSELNERERKGKIFMLHLSTLPQFSRVVSTPFYEQWVESPDDNLNKIYRLDGTMKHRDEHIEKIVKDAIVFLRKNVF